MELFKKYFIVILLTAIIAIVWGGILLVSNKKGSTIREGVQEYTQPLKATFNGEIIEEVNQRTKDSFTILPDKFYKLDKN